MQNSFFGMYFWKFNYNMLGVFFLVMPIRDSKCLLYLNVHFFPKIWKFLSIELNKFSVPLASLVYSDYIYSAPLFILIIYISSLYWCPLDFVFYLFWFFPYYPNVIIHQHHLQALNILFFCLTQFIGETFNRVFF